jgi:Mg-chelatase subunit ChlD
MANELSKSNKISVGGGLHARLKQAELLKEAVTADLRTFPNRLAIIADYSGSMDSRVAGSIYKSKLSLLVEAIQDFALRSNPADTAIAVESFPKGFRIELTNDPQQVYMRIISSTTIGDTPMGEGMQNALENHSPTRALLISDGEQTDGDIAFRIAENYKSKEILIDTVHIGDSSRGEETLKRIAAITGGIYMKFKDVQSFSSNFHYLLPESRAAIAGMLPSSVAALLGADEIK